MKASHLISISDLSQSDVHCVLELAARLKRETKAGTKHHLLAGKTLAMIFEKPSLRTRTTHEIGMFQLGGHAVHLSRQDIQMGEREPVADVARNLSRWVNGIAARTFAHSTVIELARHATVPVINALSDLEHPCEAIIDIFTLQEKFGRLQGLKLAYVGDGNNVSHSLMLICPIVGMDFAIGCPEAYRPDPQIWHKASELAAAYGTRLQQEDQAQRAVEQADVIYTDVWTSMGQEAEAEQRRRVFPPFQVNQALLAQARSGAVVMHCLPAHRGEEVTAEVLDGTQSIVYDQAENRLHVQKALLALLISNSFNHHL